MQVDPGKYKNIVNGFKVTLREDGARGLAKGWAPTFIGYSMQGLCKFGFYEVFKILYSNMLGEVNVCLLFKTKDSYKATVPLRDKRTIKLVDHAE